MASFFLGGPRLRVPCTPVLHPGPQALEQPTSCRVRYVSSSAAPGPNHWLMLLGLPIIDRISDTQPIVRLVKEEKPGILYNPRATWSATFHSLLHPICYLLASARLHNSPCTLFPLSPLTPSSRLSSPLQHQLNTTLSRRSQPFHISRTLLPTPYSPACHETQTIIPEYSTTRNLTHLSGLSSSLSIRFQPPSETSDREHSARHPQPLLHGSTAN